MILAAPDRLLNPDRRYLDVAIYHCQQAARRHWSGSGILDASVDKTHDSGLLPEQARRVLNAGPRR